MPVVLSSERGIACLTLSLAYDDRAKPASCKAFPRLRVIMKGGESVDMSIEIEQVRKSRTNAKGTSALRDVSAALHPACYHSTTRIHGNNNVQTIQLQQKCACTSCALTESLN